WTLALMESSSAAGGEQPDQGGRGVTPDRVIDVALFLAALDEPGPPEGGQVMGQGGRRDLHRFLDLAHRDFPAGADQEEEHLEPGEMGEGLEGLDVPLARVELVQGERGSLFHTSIDIKLSNRCQAPRTPRPANVQPARDVAAGSVTRTRVPSPGRLSMTRVPPWAATRCLTMAGPSPVPPSSREQARSTL